MLFAEDDADPISAFILPGGASAEATRKTVTGTPAAEKGFWRLWTTNASWGIYPDLEVPNAPSSELKMEDAPAVRRAPLVGSALRMRWAWAHRVVVLRLTTDKDIVRKPTPKLKISRCRDPKRDRAALINAK